MLNHDQTITSSFEVLSSRLCQKLGQVVAEENTVKNIPEIAREYVRDQQYHGLLQAKRKGVSDRQCVGEFVCLTMQYLIANPNRD